MATGDPRLRLTVRQLLEVPAFRLRLVAGAAGLDRPVRWAHSTELLDPGPYLRGGEVVLTVGAALSDAARCARFAESVHSSRGSAVGYGVGDVTPDVPGPLRESCDRVGLPLLEIPPEVPFLSFTEWFADRLASLRDAVHEREETGRLLQMVRGGLATPRALLGRLEEAGLDPSSLVALAVPAPAVPEPFDVPGVLLGLDHDVALLVVAGQRRAAELAASWGGPAGLGGEGPLDQLPQSLDESLAALEDGRRTGEPVRAADMATFPALLSRLDRAQLAPFVTQIARPLAEYDAVHGSRLIDTLRAFVDSGGSVGATSRSLYLHPNTLRHRLARIEALTGRNPLRFDDRVALAIAMWAAPGRPRGPG